MSIQWTLVFVFLVAELCFVSALLIPVISPNRWWRIFHSSPVRCVLRVFNTLHVIYVIGAMLILLFLDSLRETGKYSFATETHFFSDEANLVLLYRAERNMYMSAFALYLILVARRLVALVVIRQDD